MLSRAMSMSLEEHSRVEEEEDTLISDQQSGELSVKLEAFAFESSDVRGQEPGCNMPAVVVEDENEILGRAIAMSLEEHPRVEKEEESEEEMLARAFALSLE